MKRKNVKRALIVAIIVLVSCCWSPVKYAVFRWRVENLFPLGTSRVKIEEWAKSGKLEYGYEPYIEPHRRNGEITGKLWMTKRYFAWSLLPPCSWDVYLKFYFGKDDILVRYKWEQRDTCF